MLSSPLTSVWTYSFLIVCGHFTCSNGTLRSTWEHFQHTMWSSAVIPHWLGAPCFPPVGTMKMFIYSRSYIQIFMNTLTLFRFWPHILQIRTRTLQYLLFGIDTILYQIWLDSDIKHAKIYNKNFGSFGCYSSCCSIHVRWSGIW